MTIKLRNSLYLTDPELYISLDGEAIAVKKEDGQIVAHIPLHALEEIVSFSYKGVSSALLKKCGEKGIRISFMTPGGKFAGRLQTPITGNVLLRYDQYCALSNEDTALKIAKSCVIGKIYNCQWLICIIKRDHPLQVDTQKLKEVIDKLEDCLDRVDSCESSQSLLTLEAEAARDYFSVFSNLMLREGFEYTARSRRPPMDRVNALLSFAYSLLASMVTGACESAGLDPYIGAYHTLRSGKPSLALDLMEELRPVIADRFVLNLINKGMIKSTDFTVMESGAVMMKEPARKMFLQEWQKRKAMTLKHPFTEETVELGVIPFIQARLLTKFIRGEIDAYPPFMM